MNYTIDPLACGSLYIAYHTSFPQWMKEGFPLLCALTSFLYKDAWSSSEWEVCAMLKAGLLYRSQHQVPSTHSQCLNILTDHFHMVGRGISFLIQHEYLRVYKCKQKSSARVPVLMQKVARSSR